MKTIRNILLLVFFSTSLLPNIGCRKIVGPTRVHVVDQQRHYLPILQGDILRMYWTIHNGGPEPLVIDEIQPSCSAISLITSYPDVIIKGDSCVMIFDFDTDKNINLAHHKIRIFGNIDPTGVTELEFDINIVRHTTDKSDFEEHYFNTNNADDIHQGRNVRINNYFTDESNADALLGL